MTSEKINYYLFDIILPAVGSTLFILLCVVLITTITGFLLALVLYVTAPDGLRPNSKINNIFGFLANTIRSFPVIILIVAMMPYARAIIGTAIGTKAAIFYLSIACTPFVARVIEGKLKEVDENLIEAARSIGASDAQILMRFIVHDAIPSLVLGATFYSIIILGTISLAGTVGAGGIGKVALNYGYRTFNSYIMYGSIIIMVILVAAIQLIGNMIYRKLK